MNEETNIFDEVTSDLITQLEKAMTDWRKEPSTMTEHSTTSKFDDFMNFRLLDDDKIEGNWNE